MSQLNKWMTGGKISKLVIVITDKETGEHVERWQFDVRKLCPLTVYRTNEVSGANLRKAFQEPIIPHYWRQGERSSWVGFYHYTPYSTPLTRPRLLQ